MPESVDTHQLSNTLTALEINPNDTMPSIVAAISTRLLEIGGLESIDSAGAEQEESVEREAYETIDSDEQDWS